MYLFQGSLSYCQEFFFKYWNCSGLPSFEELSIFPQIACSWTFSMSVLISVRTCNYFQNNIQGFFYIFWKHFCKSLFDQAENSMFLPDRKNMISTLYTEDRKKSILKTLIITHDNKHSDQVRCRQTAKVIMSGFLHQKTFMSIPFTTQISPFFKKWFIFSVILYTFNSSEISLPICERLSIVFEKFIIYRPTASPLAGVVFWARSHPWLAL